MNCPNITHPDWLALVKEVGEKRAWALYLQNGEEIPQPSTRAEYMGVYPNPEKLMLQDEVESTLNKLSSMTGIKWKWNAELGKGVTGRWSPKGGVEINPMRITADAPWHEFLHPMIETIFRDNKTLWETMVDKLESTTTGQVIVAQVKRDYPQYTPGSDIFNKEAVTTLLGNIASTSDQNKKEYKVWEKVILYIKSLLNKV